MWKIRCMALVSHLLVATVSSAPTEPLIINVNTRRASHMVDPHFISFTISPTDLLQGRPFGMGSNLTKTMLKELSPGYVRLGGPDTNKYVFRSKSNAADFPHKPDEITITEEHWRKTNDLLRGAGMEVIACVSSGHRGGPHNKWDPRNTLDLVTYSDRMHYNITWQLGYEPIKEDSISGTQQGKDISQLRTILNGFPRYQQSKIIGPDVKVLHRKEQVEKVLDLLIEAGPAVNAVTWHPRWPHASAITPSDSSTDGFDFPPDYLEWDRNQLHKLLQRTLLKKPFWLGEPKTEHTGSFAEGLIYARRLINAAKLGIEVVMKDPILKDIAHPKAEYWVAVMHKKMLGRTVLDTWSLANHSDVSLAVHCTNRAYSANQDGGVSVLAVNMHHTEQRAVLRGFPPGLLGEQVHHYALTAGNEPQSIFSQMTFLNGEPLLMAEDGKIPDILPKNKRFGQNLVVKMPPYSIGFWVVPQAQVPACQVEPFTFPTLNLEDVATTDVLKSTQKGINNIRNMNEFLVSKIFSPLDSDDQAEDSSETTEPRKARQTAAFSSMAQELKDRMGHVKNLISMNMNALGRSAQRTDSEEIELRKTGNKIEKLADDLRAVIDGDNQMDEFSKFLELSGLKKNFGKIMMEERQARLDSSQNLGDGVDEKDRRRKRDVAFNILKKYPLVAESGKELEHLEKYYMKLLDKYHKSTKISDKKASLNLKKINRHLQEDLLLKEITVLEKTEETLTEMMKNHMERYEAIEEIMKDELEQMKDEKIAMLLEIKTKSESAGKEEPVPHPNHFEIFENFLKDQEKITKKREANKDNETPSEEEDSTDPLEAFKMFLKKWKDESGKRGSIHDKILEFRNKFKSDLEKAKASLPSKPMIKKDETKEATKTETAELSSSEKRRENVLQYMADYIDDVKEGRKTPEGYTQGSNVSRTARKIDEDEAERAKKSVTSAIISKVFDTIFRPRDDPQPKEGLVESVHLPEYVGQEISSDGTENAQELPDVTEVTEEEAEDYQKFRSLPTNQEERLPAEPLLEAMPQQQLPGAAEQGVAQQKMAQPGAFQHGVVQPRAFQHGVAQPGQAQPTETIAPAVPETADPNAVATEELATAAGAAEQHEHGDSETAGPRSKRETHHGTTTTAAPKNDLLSDAHREKLARNTIVKKVLTTTPKAEILDVANVAKMADNTLRLVFDHVIPDAYGQAKKEIESLAIPDYIKNLGKIVENLEHIDTILKDVANAASTAPTSSKHIQKMKRNRRDAEEQESTNEEIGVLPTTTLSNEPLTSHSVETTPESETYPDETHEDAGDAFEDSITTSGDIMTDAPLTTTATPQVMSTTSQEDLAIDNLEGDHIVEQVLNNVADDIVAEEVLERLEAKTTTTTQKPPPVREMGNARMKIVKKTRKYDSSEEAVSPMLSSERNIMAMIVDNMLKHHEELSRQGIKREVAGFFHPLNRGYSRRARQSVMPMQTSNDERVSQFLQQLQPGVYVVPSKDMQNVHAEQTSRTESDKNGKVKPNVVTLNIYYDKKPAEGDSQSPGGYAGMVPTAPAQKNPAASWMTRHRTQFPTLAKPQYPALAQAPQQATPAPWSALMPKYYPPLQAVPQTQPMYTGVYAEPQTYKTNAPQLVPAPSFSTWRKPASPLPVQSVNPQAVNPYQHPAYTNYWQTAAKVVQQAQQPLPQVQQQMPQIQQQQPQITQQQPTLETSYSDSWPVDSHVQPAEHPVPSNNLNDEWYLQQSSEKHKEAKAAPAKQVIEPYWNKTLKQIFQETATDPFWKFLDAPLNAHQSESEEQPENGYERHHDRKRRSLENVKSISVRAYDVRPFDLAWAAVIPDSNVNAYAQDNTLDFDDKYPRGKRSMLDNFIVKESPHVRYPMENDIVQHKVLTRPKVRKENSVDDSLGKIQLMASQNGLADSNTKTVNRFQVDSDQYLGAPSFKRAVPDSMAEEIQLAGPSWPAVSPVEPSMSETQLRSLQNQYLRNEQRDFSFPEAAVTSMADSFPFPLKQMYEMFVEFVKKMISSTI